MCITETIILIWHVFLVIQLQSSMEFRGATANENECSYFKTLWEFIDQVSDCSVSRKTVIHINFIVCLSLYKNVVCHFNLIWLPTCFKRLKHSINFMYRKLQHLKTVPLSKQSLYMFSTIHTANRGCVYMYSEASIFVGVIELRLHGNQKQ